MAFNDVLESLGGVGYFQILHTMLLLIPVAMLSCHNLLQNFTGAVPEHHCKLSSTSDLNNQSLTRFTKHFASLDQDHKPWRCVQYQKARYLLPNTTNKPLEEQKIEYCKDGWTYDRSIFSSTIVTEWNLVCNQQPWRQVPRSIYMTGVLLGALVFGSLADKYVHIPSFRL